MYYIYMYIYIYIYIIYICICVYIEIQTIITVLGASKRQISQLVSNCAKLKTTANFIYYI